MPIKVQKKDGQLEDFSRSKVVESVIKSGATSEQAENITQKVEGWAQAAAVNGVVKSSDIRSKVLELLRPVNPEAAGKFEAYKKGV